MALYIVTGAPGGGKSYFGAELALNGLKSGAFVHHCHVGIRQEKVDELGFSDRCINLPDDPRQWERDIRAGTEDLPNFLLVDEAGLSFDVSKTAKRSGDEGMQKVYELMVLNRKLGLDVYFFVQHLDNLEVKIRRVAQSMIYCLSVKRIPLVGWFMYRVYGDFRRDFRSIRGKTLSPSLYVRFSKEVGDFYRTDDLAGRSLQVQMGNATRTVVKNPDKARFIFWSVLVGLAVILAFGFATYTVGDYVGDFTSAEQEERADLKTGESLNVSGKVSESLGFDRGGKDPLPSIGARYLASGSRLRWDGYGWVEESLKFSDGRGAFEWYQEDELILHGHIGTRILTDRGPVDLGVDFEGDVITSIVNYGGRHYVTTAMGRTYLVRPLSREERISNFEKWKQQNISRTSLVPGYQGASLASPGKP
jgi:hypothetical protein